MALDGRLKRNIATVYRALRPASARLTVLYYHAVAAADVANFSAQMAYLARHSFVVPVDYSGPLPADRPSVAISFDDAFDTVIDNAVPVLDQYALPYAIFVPSGWLGQTPGWAMETETDRVQRVATADRLARLLSDRVIIGSHTIDHPRLSQIPANARQHQLAGSRSALADLFGAAPDLLAFPYGDHDDGVLSAARAAGYRYVYTVMPSPVRAHDDRFVRGRTAADPADPMPLFIDKAHGAFDWVPLASRLKRALR